MEGFRREKKIQIQEKHKSSSELVAKSWSTELDRFLDSLKTDSKEDLSIYGVQAHFDECIHQFANDHQLETTEVAKIFFDELCFRIKEQRLSQVEANYIAEYILHSSDSLEAYLPSHELFSTIVEMQMHSVSREAFLQRLYLNFGYRTQGLDSVVSVIEQYLSTHESSPTEYMHAVRALQRILTAVQGNGIDGRQSNTAFVQAVARMGQEREEPIVDLFTTAITIQAQAYSGMQKNDFSDPTVDQAFQAYQQRRNSNLQEHRSLSTTYNFEPALRGDQIVLQTAKDRIGVYDSEGFVVALGEIPAAPGETVVLRPARNIDALQQLYRPEMQVALEKEMNIQLTELPFRGQQQLANFLVQGKEQDINRFQQVFKGDIQNDYFSQAFFSSVFDAGMPARLLNIAEAGPEAEAVFKEYAQLVDVVDHSIVEITLPLNKKESIRERMLLRGKELLVAASFIVEQGSNAPLPLEKIVQTMQYYCRFMQRYLGTSIDDDSSLQLSTESIPAIQELEPVRISYAEYQWYRDMRGQDELQDLYEVSRITEQFYGQYVEMNSDASETTGDTRLERSRLLSFFEDIVQKTPQPVIVDAGCGDGQRITEHIAAHLPQEARIIGLDLMAVEALSHDTIEYRQADLTKPQPDLVGQADVVMSTWSVVNDVLRRQDQIAMFLQFANMLKDGGSLYIDVPWLEGGDGSWEQSARAFYEKYNGAGYSYGMIEASFARSAGDALVKKFNIYPTNELYAMLEYAGFEIMNGIPPTNAEAVRTSRWEENISPTQSPAWRTQGVNSKPRLTIIARKKTASAQDSRTFTA